MASIYSTCFAAEKELSTDLVLTVPEGVVWILRDFDAWHGSQASDVEVFLLGAAGQAIFHDEGEPLSTGNPQWRGRQVIESGQTVTISVTLGNYDVSLSGYVLTAP